MDSCGHSRYSRTLTGTNAGGGGNRWELEWVLAETQAGTHTPTREPAVDTERILYPRVTARYFVFGDGICFWVMLYATLVWSFEGNVRLAEPITRCSSNVGTSVTSLPSVTRDSSTLGVRSKIMGLSFRWSPEYILTRSRVRRGSQRNASSRVFLTRAAKTNPCPQRPRRPQPHLHPPPLIVWMTNVTPGRISRVPPP